MKIKEYEPQPIDCPKCNDKLGYRVTTVQQIHSDVVYNPDGEYKTIIDSEYRKNIRTLKRIVCTECLTKLNFEVES